MTVRAHLFFSGLASGNAGDDMMFLGLARTGLLAPGSTAEVYDTSPEALAGLPPELRYLDFRDTEACRGALQGAEVALLAGDTPVMEDWGLAFPLEMLAQALPRAADARVPLHVVGIGADPIRSPEGRALFQKAFAEAVSWTVRDDASRESLLDLGVDAARVLVAADLAWLCRSPVQPEPKGDAIGVCVVNERWPGPTPVKRALAAALDRFHDETGIRAVFLSTEARTGDYMDDVAADQVIALMRSPSGKLAWGRRTPAELMTVVARFPFVVSQRYHFTLMALQAGTPALSFARGHKLAGLLSELGDEPIGTMDAADADVILSRLRAVHAHPAAQTARVSNAVRHLRHRAEAATAFLASPAPRAHVRLASVPELESPPYQGFLALTNHLGAAHGLRQMTEWSKVWEYPWLWLNGLCRAIRPGARLLDIGSEMGAMPWFFASLGAHVHLVEVNDGSVALWTSIRAKTGLPVDWTIVPGCDLPFPDASFDVVTSFSVIEHQDDPARAVAEAARVLRPGGLLALSFDICEADRGMTFPAWNGKALTTAEFERFVWQNPLFERPAAPPAWNWEDEPGFRAWNLRSAPHHNYIAGAAVMIRSGVPVRGTS